MQTSPRGAITSVFAFSGIHTDTNTETHRDRVFFIWTWFQKSAFSGSENAASAEDGTWPGVPCCHTGALSRSFVRVEIAGFTCAY